MKVPVRCNCGVERVIDVRATGSCRLRCRRCGDILYDPTSEVGQVEFEDDDSQFQAWLEGSAELNVIHSSDGEDALPCPEHPDRRVVAACSHCSQLLCKRCLDKIDDEFVCQHCVEASIGQEEAGQGTFGWLKRILGG